VADKETKVSDESIFQHDRKPAYETATDAILHTGIYNKELEMCLADAAKVLLAKNIQYGDSWKTRGGVGAFMIFARKWDRIELQAKRHGYHIFKACDADWGERDNLMDDIRDLRNYLTLVEHEMRKQHGDFQGRNADVHNSNTTDNPDNGGDAASRVRLDVSVR
jgi:hypothetical protein